MTLLFCIAGCGGATAGKTSLVRLVAEPPGANCASGGTEILVGVDANGNGMLQDSEVTSTQYVCAGATGTAGSAGSQGTAGNTGAAGKNELVLVVPEPAGSNCTYGGSAIETGIDTNGDGILESGEIDASTTQYVCKSASIAQQLEGQGDITIVDQFDAQVAHGITHVSGKLVISNTQLSSIDFPLLTTVDGDLVISGNSNLTSISLPSLASVGGALQIAGSGSLNSLDVSALATVSGNFTIANATYLPALPLPMLTSAGGVIIGATAVSTLAFPSLTTLGDGGFSITTAATTLSVPVLSTVSGSVLLDHVAASTVTFPQLTSAGSVLLQFSSVSSLSLPMLDQVGAYGSWAISDNASLVAFSAPMVKSLPGNFLYIGYNASLRQCLVDAFVAQLSPSPTTSVTTNNNGTPNTCP